MKRLLALLAALALLAPCFATAETYAALPSFFHVSYRADEKTINSGKSFVSKDYVTTARPEVDAEINGLVDQFEAEYAPGLKPDKNKNPRRNSRLDIHVVHTVSGDSLVSFLVLARDSYGRKQRQSPFTTRVYDMMDGRLITLQDLFDGDSPAWEIMGQAVSEGLNAYYPKEQADPDAVAALCSREALQDAPFMLGPASLSFHFEASALYPKHPCLMKITIPYQKLRDMMNEYGQRQTDNAKYRMVALTFDDGPAYENSAKIINSLRTSGAQATFFLVGERISEYVDIVMRENDETHSLQSHHYKHSDTTKSNTARIQAYTTRFYDIITQTIGSAPIMLRPPYGKFDPFVKAKINLPLIGWDVDTKDWTGKSASAVLSVVRKEVKPGSIILMHDIKDKTPASAQAVLEWLKQNDYLCVTVEDLFAHFDKPMVENHVYYRVNAD